MYLQCICATNAADYGRGWTKRGVYVLYTIILLQCYSYAAIFSEYSPMLNVYWICSVSILHCAAIYLVM